MGEQLQELLGAKVAQRRPLHGGMVAKVELLQLLDGRRLVAKSSHATPLSVEGAMLQFLAMHTDLPVPGVIHSSEQLLLLEYLEGESLFNDSSERHAAELLAALHSITPRTLGDLPGTGGSAASESFGTVSGSGVPANASSDGFGLPFGFPFDTLIGPLPQMNEWTTSWPRFFGSRRLEPMVVEGLRRGRLPQELGRRIRSLIERLDELLDHSPAPSLVHGDVWSANVLAADDRITGMLDPATYFADAEVELAFIELFGTFGGAFWQRYTELRTVDDGYDHVRRDLYQLYPLLVHVALFGGGYVGGVEERLRQLGY